MAAPRRSRCASIAGAVTLVVSVLAIDARPAAAAPIASVGGPYTIAEGDPLTLDGSGSTGSTSYAWDLDNDGQFDDAVGPNPSLTWPQLVALGIDDDGTHPIALETGDGATTDVDTAPAGLVVSNAEPTITVTGTDYAPVGSPYDVTVSIDDPGNDTITGWTISWGDSTVDTEVGTPGTVSHTFAASGQYDITVSVTDEDGTWTDADLLAPSFDSIRHLGRYDGNDGAFVSDLTGTETVDSLVEAEPGPDGLLYVSSYVNSRIARYDPATNQFVDFFITTGVTGPNGLAFGPDGDLYVANWDLGSISRFDGVSGAARPDFVAAGSNGLTNPTGISFGPDGHLYVADAGGSIEVQKFDGSTGASLGAFVNAAGIGRLEDLAFGPDGDLYTVSLNDNRVRRFDGTTGAAKTDFVAAGVGGLSGGGGITFGPDGHLYVSSSGTDSVKKYDGQTGATLGDLVAPGTGGMNGPSFISFVPDKVVVASSPLIVNSTDDDNDNSPGDGRCDTGSNNSQGADECTLRAAITEANALAGYDVIRFDIPQTESGYVASPQFFRIRPSALLPLISTPMVIDGSSQPEFTTNGRPVIEIDGQNVTGSDQDGLVITGDAATIRALVINDWTGDGIEVDSTATNTVIVGNHIGLDPTGLLDRGNGIKGIDIQSGSSGATVGGTTAADRNIISGNGNDGVIIWNSTNNVVIGNYIGTDITGNASAAGIGNGADGVVLGSGAANNTIGQPGAGNVLSGNANDGFENDATGADNTVQANTIGLGADGATPVANGRYGVVLYNGANNTEIGGPGPGEGNVISSNVDSGIIIDGNSNPATTANTIAGNLIGTDGTGTLDRGNGGSGIHFFSGANGNTIGGPTPAHGNVISGNYNEWGGVYIVGPTTNANVVQFNRIGTNALGDSPIPNNLHGVVVSDAPDTQILDNIIAGNDVHGVYLYAGGTTGTQVLRNTIGTNAAQTARMDNGFDGIRLEGGSSGSVIGTIGNGNVISGNTQHGISINSSSNNTIQGNWIGTNTVGSLDLGNGLTGVFSDVFGSSSNLIGGHLTGQGNTIAFNASGVALESGNNNAVVRNSIHDNDGLGIDLVGGTEDGFGVTTNGTATVNDGMSYPVISSAADLAGSVTVDFDLDVPAGDYRIDLFTSPGGADPSGYGEGHVWETSATVTHAGAGSQSFQILYSGSAGDQVTLTATEQSAGPVFGSSSEFSAASAVAAGATYLDLFTTVGTNGTDGTVDWSGSPWLEQGEVDGTSAGRAHIGTYGSCLSGNCIRIGGDEVSLTGYGWARPVNLSGATSATFSLELVSASPDANLAIQVSDDGGGTWSTLETTRATGTKSHNILAWASADTWIRVVGSGTPDNAAFLYVDDVQVAYTTLSCVDDDGDGLCSNEEDANTDADNDPATSPGPDTDGDTFPNYLDADDDNDGSPTASENADPNGDGDPRDARDVDRDGEPDYLDLPTDASPGSVATAQKISETQGGLVATLTTNDHFGRSVASIGDVDGDGVTDIAVGAHWDDDGGADRGAVYILFMNTDGTVKAEQKISDLAGGLGAVLDNSDEFGIGVAGLGDLDGDGINDIAVGSHQDDDGLNGNGGAVHVLFLNADGTVKVEQKISETTGGLGVLFDANDRFGSSVANIGDLDGDGLNDLVVGAKDDDDAFADSGAVYVLFLDSDGTVTSTQKISQTAGGLSGAPLGGSDGFGISVAGLGDVDGDGSNDIAVGSYWDDDGGTNHGAVYVLFLNPDGTVQAQQKISDTTGGLAAVLASNDEFGTAVGGVGDIDADGVPDLLVGAPKDDDGTSLSGSAYMLFLDSNGTVKGEQKISNTEGSLGVTLNTSDQFGFAVAGTGDLDGDGTIGLAVGVYGDDDGGPADRGAVYVLDLADVGATISGTVFEDIAADLLADGTIGSPANPGSAGVTVELWDGSTVVGTDTTDVLGGYSFPNVPNGSYTVRVDSTTVPSAQDPAALPGEIWADQTYGPIGASCADGSGGTYTNPADGSCFGGVTGALSDREVPTYWKHRVPVTVAGSDVSGLDFGFSFNVVTNQRGGGFEDDDTGTNRTVQGSLRQFIQNANAINGPNAMRFVPVVPADASDGADAWWHVGVSNALPTLATGGTTIDGTALELLDGVTVRDDNARGPELELDGTGIAAGTDGLMITGGTATVRDLVINRFARDGIRVTTAGSNTIAGNYVGTNAVGTAGAGNGNDGIRILSAGSNQIGGTSAADRNVISGNGNNGALIDGLPSTGNLVQGNRIGTNALGTAPIPNLTGVGVSSGASGNIIGGTTPAHGNLISENTVYGIDISGSGSDGNVVSANLIGTDVSGTADLGNGSDGIALRAGAQSNVVGGTTVGERNVISGNDNDGVWITGVGTNGNTVIGNWIGFGTDSSPVGNSYHGVAVENGAADNAVGGDDPVDRNRIGHSGWDGVTVGGTGTGNSILGNSIVSNAGIGIDLEGGTEDGFGVTTNDPGDSGPNDLLDHPVINSATVSGGIITVSGTFDAPAGNYRFEFFLNPSGGDGSGHGEGDVLVGSSTLAHGGSGPQPFGAAFPGSAGDVISATITEESAGPVFGSTSEFSAWVFATANGGSALDSSVRRSDMVALGGLDLSGSVAGVAGDGFDLAGGSERLSGPATDIESSGLTLAGWVHLDTAGTDPRLVAKAASDGTAIYELLVDDATGEAVARLNIGGGTVEVRGGTVPTGSWHQLAATWDGATVRLFVDGVEVDSAAGAGTLATNVSVPLNVGNLAAANRGVNGRLDHIEISHTARSGDHIATAFANITDPASFVSMGVAQTSAPPAWTVSTSIGHSGSNSLAAPEVATGAEAWATAIGVDEPGVEFRTWWLVSDPTLLTVAAGSRTGLSPTDQNETALTPAGFDLATLVGSTRTQEASTATTIGAATWAEVILRTDESGTSSVWVDGIQILGSVLHSGGATTGSVGLRAAAIPTGETWHIDDVRLRRFVSDEPVTSLGPLDRS